MSLDAIRELGTRPVSDAAPAGESVRYEAEFEQLSAEIEKLSSVEQTPVDWRVVCELAERLLRDKGKDLLVASYLAIGLLERQGYPGLAAGVDVLAGLCDNFWDGLFPELRRLRARINALEWFAGRLEKVLETRSDPGESDREPLEACVAGLSKLIEDPGGRFGQEGPNLGPARRALKGKLDLVPKPPEPEPEPQSETAQQPAAVATPAPAQVAPPPPPPPPEPEPATTPESVLEQLARFRKQQLEYARVLLEDDDANPRGYLLLREAVWSEQTLADRDRESVGGDEFLAVQQKDLAEGEYEAVLERCEKLLLEHPLWLDLQMLTAHALEGMGRRYRKAHSAVLAALTFLLNRNPGLAAHKNLKGQAFASDAAQVWLQNEVLVGPAGASAGRGADGADVGSEARKLVARGQLGDAMRLMTQRIEMTASRRGRFVLRLDLAQLCIEAGRMELAVPQLEQLEQEVGHFSLEEWEPDLATRVVRSLWQCCSGATPAAALAERQKDIYARLCRLDPAAAVTTPGPRGD